MGDYMQSAGGFGAGLSAAQINRLRQMGRVWNRDISGHRQAVIEMFTPVVAAGRKDGIGLHRNLPYGPDPRNVVDVFVPRHSHVSPVVIFIHGGAFTRGSKSVNGDIYDNVLFWFAQQGFVAVNVEYRLAPAASFPAGPLDVASAIQWTVDNIARYGGDPACIIAIGHSAGGSHLASYLLDPDIDVVPSPAIRAAIFVSARLRLEIASDNPNADNVAACFGRDPNTLTARSPVMHADRCRWPVMIAFAEFENRHLDTYSLEFAHRLSQGRRCAPRVIQCIGHNHTSIVAHFNSGDDNLGNAMLDFLARDCCITAEPVKATSEPVPAL